MAIDGVNNKQMKTQQSYEDFGAFADRLNKTVPDVTSTVEEKKHAIEVKKKIMNHPQCPSDTKTTLRKEIGIIQGEIDRINHDTAMNTSVFGTRNDLG